MVPRHTSRRSTCCMDCLWLTVCRKEKQYHKTAKISTSLNIRQGDSLKGYSDLQMIEKCIKHDTLRQDYQRWMEDYKAWTELQTRQWRNAPSRSRLLDLLRSQKSQSLHRICRALWFSEPSASSQEKMYKKVQLENPAVNQDSDHFHWPAKFPEVFVPSCKQPICRFDAVVGNPPWRKVRGVGAREEEREQQRAEGEAFLADVSPNECYGPEISEIRQPDFFHYLIGRGLQLLKESQEPHEFLDFVVPPCLWETKD